MDEYVESTLGEQGSDDAADGTFVETAFSDRQVDAAIVAEKNRGLDGAPCGFLGDVVQPGAGK